MPATSASRTLFIILGYIAAVLVGGALLAPVLFFAAQSAIQHSPDGALARLLSNHEFPGYFNRAAMLVAVVGLFPLLRLLRVQWGQVLGEVPLATGWKQVLLSFALALIFILIMGLVCLWADAVKMKLEPRWSNIAKPLISGVSVAFLEEFLFRGAVLVILCHALGKRAGLWWMVAIFSILHFLKPPLEGSLPDSAVNWGSGFWVITQLFSGFKTWNAFVGEFLLLATVGWVLGRVRLASGGLWVGIGLHAGWVAGMKYFSGVVDRRGSVDVGEFSPWMVKNTCRAIVSPIVGIVPLLAVLATGLIALWMIHHWWPRQELRAPAQKGA